MARAPIFVQSPLAQGLGPLSGGGGLPISPLLPTDLAGLGYSLYAYYQKSVGVQKDDGSGGFVAATAGDGVARWLDQSGNNRHLAETTAIYRPIADTTLAVKFNGTNRLLYPFVIGNTGAAVFTFLCVASYTAVTAWYPWGYAVSTMGRQIILVGNGRTTYAANNIQATVNYTKTGVRTVYGCIVNGSTVLIINGLKTQLFTNVPSTTYSPATYTTMAMGASRPDQAPSQSSSWLIGDVLFVNSSISYTVDSNGMLTYDCDLARLIYGMANADPCAV